MIVAMQMMEDLADLFEQSAANGTPIREIVGEDPVEFIETFLQNYEEGRWINKERERLIKTIEQAEQAQGTQSNEDGDARRDQRPRSWRSRMTTCRCCAEWTSTWSGAQSSRCSAPMGQARRPL